MSPPTAPARNLEHLAGALDELDARIRGAGLPDEGLAVDWHADLLERMDTALDLITRHGPLDLSLRPSGTDGYEDLVRSASSISVAGVEVPTASLEDIVRSKEAAGRAKDNLALPVLLAHLRDRPASQLSPDVLP